MVEFKEVYSLLRISLGPSIIRIFIFNEIKFGFFVLQIPRLNREKKGRKIYMVNVRGVDGIKRKNYWSLRRALRIIPSVILFRVITSL